MKLFTHKLIYTAVDGSKQYLVDTGTKHKLRKMCNECKLIFVKKDHYCDKYGNTWIINDPSYRRGDK